MIVGIGCDLIGIERIRAVHQRQGQRFLDRIYTLDEQRYCLGFRDPAERLAARWAAKEACMKALGTGWAQGVGFTDISVVHASGQPGVHLSGAAERRAQLLGVVRSHLTLSHSDGLAMAVVVLERAHAP